jgi:replicative DNA helicase
MITDLKLPPQNPEAERGVLGCCLLAASECFLIAQAAIKNTAGAFYDLRHQYIWRAMAELEADNTAIDLITVSTRLKNSALLDQVGLSYLAELVDCVPSIVNLPSYIEIVVSAWRRRGIMQAALASFKLAEQEGCHIDQVASEVERSITQAIAPPVADEIETMAAILSKLSFILEDAQMHRNHDGLSAGSVPTGIGMLDKRIAGLTPGTVFLLGARPSTGKTALITSLIINIAVTRNIPVAFQSMEMARCWIVLRIWCAVAMVNYYRIHSGFASKAEYAQLLDCGPRLVKAPIFIDDAAGLTPGEFRSRGRRLLERSKAKVLFVDHINEVRDPRNRGDEKIDVTDTIHAARDVGRVSGTTVFAAAQMNREAARAGNESIAHLRGSGHLEQVADVIGILRRDKDREEKAAEETNWTGRDAAGDEAERLITLQIDKQRNGPPGPVWLKFLVQPMLMLDATPGGRGSMAKNET